MKIRVPKGTWDLEEILMLGLVVAVLLMDAFAACGGEPPPVDAMGKPDAAATGVPAMSDNEFRAIRDADRRGHGVVGESKCY